MREHDDAPNSVGAYDFALPENLIALRPCVPRDGARLLHVAADGTHNNRHVRDLPNLLRKGDALIVNVTKVIPARLQGLRVRANSEAKVEITLTERQDAVRWACFLKPAKRVAQGDIIAFDDVTAQVLSRTGREAVLQFDIAPQDMETTLAQLGAMPLPPYIASKRAPDAQDTQDYQTIYARVDGAVAAPTAGLHFTPHLLAQCQEAGVSVHEVVLHVGPGTFLPVSVDNVRDHKMHGEWGQITPAIATALNAVRANGGRLVCVGTTALRLLETACTADGRILPFEGSTDIFITPGTPIHSADVLLTNFHLPRSTLFMLVSAFSGYNTMQAAYAHAIKSGYRFYSYGDACLLEKANAIHPAS